MNSRYFATHAAGFGPLVRRLVIRDCPGAEVFPDGENAVVIAWDRVPSPALSYCRGLFRLLAETRGSLDAAARSFAKTARIPVSSSEDSDPGRGRGSARSFVLRSFSVDDPAAIPRESRVALEGAIAKATLARPDSMHPQKEYRLQERSGGRVFLLERSLHQPGSEAELRPGELPRSTCRLLAELSDPREDDVFLDPFCGYGGIVLERCLAKSYRFAFAQDLDPDKIAAFRQSLDHKLFERRRKTIFPKERDALDPQAFDAGFVSAIVTDPPWGLYEGSGFDAAGAQALLGSFIAVAETALASDGRLVLLVSRSFDTETLLAGLGSGRSTPMPLSMRSSREGSGFKLVESLDVLISGKKARVLRLDRR